METVALTRLAGTQFWQLTALVAAIGVLVRLFGRNRPHLAHVLWLVVLLKCVTPPLWNSPSGVFCWVQGATAEPVAASPPRLGVTLDRAALQPGAFAAPMLDVRPSSQEFGVDAIAPPSSLVWRMAGGVWLFGAALVAAASTWRWRRSCAELGRHAVAYDPDYDQLLARLARRLGLKRRVRLLVTASRVGPAVVGLSRPVIVLPEIIVRGKRPADLEPILAHELIHVRRGDLWIGLLQTVAQACWWFHPLVWLANRLISREAERCCDEEVIGELGCAPARYARSLLDVLELKRALKPVPAFPGVRPVEVTSQRLERIMKLGQGCRKRNPWWCWLVLLLGAATALPGAALAVAGDEDGHDGASHETGPKEAIVLSPYRSADDVLYFWPAPKETDATPTGAAALAGANEVAIPKDAIPKDIAERLKARGVALHVLQPSAIEASADRLWVRGGRLAIEYCAGGDKALSFEAQTGAILTAGPAAAESEPLTIELSGQVQMKNQSELTASADRMRVRVARDLAVELDFSGAVAIDGEGFSVHAERAVLRSGRLLLQGAAEFRRKSDDGNTIVETLRAQKIEWDVRGGLLRADGAAVIDLQGGRRAWRGAGQLFSTAGANGDGGVQGGNEIDRDHPEAKRRQEAKWDRKRAQADRPASTVRVYAVADLVVPVADRVRVAPSKPGDGATAAKPTAANADFQPLIELITTTIQPETWEKAGGPGALQGLPTNLSLVVSQTSEVHEQLSELLSQLRRLQDVQVSLQVCALRLDEMFFERVGLDFDFESEDGSPTGLARLSQRQARLLIEAAQGDPRSSISQSPKITLFNGQAAELALSLFGETAPAASGAFLQLVPAVSSDRRSVRLTLAVGAKDAIEALASSRSTSLAAGQSLLLDVADESISPNFSGETAGAHAAGQLRLFRRASSSDAEDRLLLLITPQIVVAEEEEAFFKFDDVEAPQELGSVEE